MMWNCRAALALAEVGSLDAGYQTANAYKKVEYPYRRERMMGEAAEGIADMKKGFGGQHLLVLRMQDLYNRLNQSPFSKRMRFGL